MEKKLSKYILPPLFSILLLLLIFFIKNIFPFGNENISTCDMSQLFVPMYTHLYDALHGTKSLFFDWYSAGSTNMAGLVSFIGLINPLNILFFYFIPRENILEYMSVYLMIKMSLSSFTMSFYLIKKYPRLETLYHIIFSIIYVFSGYVLQYYTNINWLDFTILFPILILSLDKLLRTGKYGYYTLSYTLCLISSIYLSFMVTIFIILYTGVYMFILMPKKQRKKRIFNFALSSVFSLLLSSFITIPAVIQMISSIRSQLNLPFLEENLTSGAIFNKVLILLCLELPLILTLKLSKKNNKKSTFLLCTTFLILLPLAVERINLLYHTGSYVLFATRFGFIISFMLVSCAAYYLSHFSLNTNSKKDNVFILTSIFLLLINLIFSLLIYSKIKWQAVMVQLFEKNTIIYLLTFLTLLLILYLSILKIKNKTIQKLLTFLTVSFEVIFISFSFIGSKTDSLIQEYYPEHSSHYIKDIYNIKEKISYDPNPIQRIKCKDFIFSSNYPYILSNASFSNWTNMISKNILFLTHMLGYSTNYTRIIDYGGTIFSDALLNYDYTFSKDKLSDILYEKVDETKEFKLYKNKISLPFGITINKDFINLKYENNPFQYQNEIFNSLFNDTLIDIIPFNEKIDITKESILYVYYPDNTKQDITYKVNNQEVFSIGNKNTKNYQKSYGGIIELGIFNNETVNLEVISDKSINKKKYIIRFNSCI